MTNNNKINLFILTFSTLVFKIFLKYIYLKYYTNILFFFQKNLYLITTFTTFILILTFSY